MKGRCNLLAAMSSRMSLRTSNCGRSACVVWPSAIRSAHCRLYPPWLSVSAIAYFATYTAFAGQILITPNPHISPLLFLVASYKRLHLVRDWYSAPRRLSLLDYTHIPAVHYVLFYVDDHPVPYASHGLLSVPEQDSDNSAGHQNIAGLYGGHRQRRP